MKIIISPFSKQLRNGQQNPKTYPFWNDLVNKLKVNHYIIQVGVNTETDLGCHEFKKNLSLNELKELINECDLWISVDNFFHHLAQFTNKDGVVIFAFSDPNIFGYKNNLNILKDRKYLRPDQFNDWESYIGTKEAFYLAEELYNIIFNDK